MDKLTQKELKRFLWYSPKYGIFIWVKRPPHSSIKVGDVAGYRLKESGYHRIKIKSVLYQSHRLAFLYMTGSFPDDMVDHINRITWDNRWCNLRLATNSLNQSNIKIPIDNKSGVIGVQWREKNQKWEARVVVNKIYHYLGLFTSKSDAIKARLDGELKFKNKRFDGRG